MSRNLRFGVFKPEDMIAKAKRELHRLKVAPEQETLDHAMNAAMTVSHLTDWVFHAAISMSVVVGNWSQFAGAARRTCGAVASITDIANASKHFEVSRSASDVTAVGPGDLILVQDFLLKKYEPPLTSRGGTIKNIRTIIEDDEIVRFETITSGLRIDAPSGPRLFEDACLEALDFWEATLNELKQGTVPNWLR